jgi:hypothetical protein
MSATFAAQVAGLNAVYRALTAGNCAHVCNCGKHLLVHREGDQEAHERYEAVIADGWICRERERT